MKPAARRFARVAVSPSRTAGSVAASLLAVFAVSTALATGPRTAAPLDGAPDKVVLGAFVPSGIAPLGEVRLVRRGAAVVMQTVLHTRFLERAVAEIRKKELASWPRGRAGREDALRYIGAVLEARERIRERAATRGRAGGRQAMLIEFVLSDTSSVVEISEPEVEREDGHMRIVSKRPLSVLELSRTYVRGDIVEIARDALGLGEKESKDLLEPLLPPEPGGDAASSGQKVRKGAGP